MSQSVSFDGPLALLALQVHTTAQQAQERGQKHKEYYLKQLADQALTTFETLIATELDSELRAELHLRFRVNHESQGTTFIPEANFDFANAAWRIRQSYPQRSAYPWQWEICATNGRDSYAYVVYPIAVQPLALRGKLLVSMAERLEEIRVQKQQQADRTQQQAQQILHEQEIERQQSSQRAERIKQADQEHQRLCQQLDELKQQAEASLWKWPEGITIYLYAFTYMAGIVRTDDDEEENVIEAVHAWTSTDHLDSQGYIRLEETCAPWGVRRAKDVKLSPSIHMPVWERIQVGSVDELSSELRKEIVVSIPGVVARTHSDLDNKERLTQIEEHAFDFEELVHRETVGVVPLPWVQQLIEVASIMTQPDGREEVK